MRSAFSPARFLVLAMVMMTLLAVPTPSLADDTPPACEPGTEGVIWGTEGDDVINGTQHSDVICGLGGDDVINGGNGEDAIYGGPGDDTIDAGNGKDLVDAGSGDDTVDGGNGKDVLEAGEGQDVVNGGNGKDECGGAEQATSCETQVACLLTPDADIRSHRSGDVVDTSAAGNGTGSFTLSGVAPLGTDTVTVRLADAPEDASAALLAAGYCRADWSIDTQVPQTQTIDIIVTAMGSYGTQTDTVSLDVIAASADDVLIAPAFVSTPQHPDLLLAYDAETGQMVFDGDLTGELTAGDGLVSVPLDLAPEGYLRIVLSVVLVDGTTVVETRQADLTEYVRQLDLSTSFPPGSAAPMVLGSNAPEQASFASPSGASSSSVESAPAEESGPVDPSERKPWASPSSQDSPPPPPGPQDPSSSAESSGPSAAAISNDDIEFIADFIVNPGFDVDIKIDFRRDGCTFCLPKVVVDRIFFEASLDLEAEASLTYFADDLYSKRQSFGPRLDDFQLGKIVIPLPVGGIVVSLEAEGQAFYDISVNVAMKAEYKIGIRFVAGYEYRGDGTGQGTYTDASTTGGLAGEGLDLRAGIVLSAAVGIEMDLEALLFGKVGFEIEARPQLELEAFADAASKTIPWKIQLVVPLAAGLEVEIKLGPIKYDKEFGNIEFAQFSLILLDGVIFEEEDEDGEDDPSDDVAGDGVTIVEDEVTGSPDQWGRVDGFVPGEQTWVLSTGRIGDTVGPPSSFASTSLGLPGDSRLSALSGFVTYDATAYVARVVAEGSTLHIRYAFASEEYPEYVGSGFNDVMAVFVDGENCALVPGTQTPVAINTINHLSNTQYYVDNSSGASGYGTTMDGLTVPLTCSVPVTPGEEVEIRIAVADASDGIYDSAVALLDGGIWSE